jgi:hypothetical protein
MTVSVADVHAHVQRLVSVVKMATVLEECTTEEMHSIVHYLWAKGLNAKDIHKECFLFMVGTAYHVKRFRTVEKFSQGRSKVADDAQPVRPVETETEATMQGVEELIQADRRIMIDSATTALVCSHGSAYSIMHDHLKFRKVCTWWVPRELKDQRKINRMCLSLQHLLQYKYADDGENMLNRIVTRDKSWVYHYQPKSKHASMQWKHPSSPSTKKFEAAHAISWEGYA